MQLHARAGEEPLGHWNATSTAMIGETVATAKEDKHAADQTVHDMTDLKKKKKNMRRCDY